ncbi:MAG: DUF6266 family protein [Bacteroidales bacterium]|nr:DUF6266 family protein [Bacteroidales bacterium]
MGKIKQGIMGGFAGKVGPVIGTSWKGKAVMRSRALSFNDRNSQAQQEQRARFSIVIKFVSAIGGFISVGFRSRAVGMTAPNAAVSANIGEVITGTFPNYEIDYSKALVSAGSLDLPFNAQATVDSNTLSLTWADNSGMGTAKATDKVMILIYNKTKNQSVSEFDVASRSERTGSVTIPTAWNSDSVEVWLAMNSLDGTLTSKSAYLGSFTI